MNRLKKLFATLGLVCALGLTVFAGQTDTPPCSPPDPGQTDTPPCILVQGNGSSDSLSGASDSTVASVDNRDSVAEIAMGLLEAVLPLL
jgi:hypothetical protein